MSCIDNSFKWFDIISEPVLLTYQKNQSYPTCWGGFISLLGIMATLLYTTSVIVSFFDPNNWSGAFSTDYIRPA
jgi:hypothetical protein